MQRSRQFAKAKEVKEVEELKGRTTCHGCGRRGHWAKECPQPKGSSKGSKPGSTAHASASGAAAVETVNDQVADFVAAVSSLESLVDRVRAQVTNKVHFTGVSSGVSIGVEPRVRSFGLRMRSYNCGGICVARV